MKVKIYDFTIIDKSENKILDIVISYNIENNKIIALDIMKEDLKLSNLFLKDKNKIIEIPRK